MQQDTAEYAGFDPNAPLTRFITGVVRIFYGDSEATAALAAQRQPDQLKAAVEDLILDIVPEVPATPDHVTKQELAADAVAAAWDALATGAPDAEELALAALRYDLNCADAYSLLGVSAGEQVELALPLFTLAVMAGAEALGPEGFERYAGQFWQAAETRPFMGALGFLARANRDAGALDAAAAHLVEMLNLNPADDQGARYDLVAIALETGRVETAEKILEAYRDDSTATFAYARALFAFQRGGDDDPARLALRAARTANAHVIDFLLQVKPIPESLEETVSAGSEMEAALIVEMLGPAWLGTKGAVEWLKQQTVTVVVAPPAKEKRSGPREV